MQNLTAYSPFRSGHALANTLVVALSIHLVVSALSALWLLFQILTGAAARLDTSEELTLLDLVDLGLALLLLLVFLMTVVLFCIWVHRVYSNLAALGNPKQALQNSPAWAVGSFFIPILHLYVPYRCVREVWAKSDPEVSGDNHVLSYEPSAPGHMKLWWVFWVASNILANVSLRVYLRADTEGEMLVSAWLDLLSDVATVAAAAFAVMVVRGIDSRQEQRSRRVNYFASAPPPPPIFTSQPSGTPQG